MSVVNYATGEIVEVGDSAAAERRAERITLRLDAIADNYRAVLPMIREAIERRDDLTLGYRSPGDYVSDRFGQSLAGLGVDVRRAVVGELTEAGLSTRAIAPVVGTHFTTVADDIKAGGVGSPTPSPQSPESALDASAIAVDQGAGSQGEVAPSVTEAGREQETTGIGVPTAPRPAVTGIDGKKYTRPEPKPALAGAAADYDNAEQASRALSRAISKLLEFQHPNMREGMRRYWSMASVEVPPTPRRDVTPEQMRIAAQGLLTLADEWDDQ